MHKASVIIPYRERDEWSALLLKDVLSFWGDVSKWEVIISDSSPDFPFNRSEARNTGAQIAENETLIFCDADTYPGSPLDVVRAIEAVANGQRTWFGCKTYFQLTEEFTRYLLEGGMDFDPETDTPWDKAMTSPPGGVTICGFDAFERVGGYDEHFEGWGYEDSAFQAAMTAMWGQRQFLGDVYHLWHPKVRSERQQQPHITENRLLFERYLRTVSGGPAALDELLDDLREERHG
jgi:predicted glycosyltransferase involved in capsule biosynthesis